MIARRLVSSLLLVLLASVLVSASRFESNALTFESAAAGQEEMARNYEFRDRPVWARESWRKAADAWRGAAEEAESVGEAAHVLFLHASLHAERRDAPAAIAACREIVTRWPESPWATSSRKMLEMVEGM